MPPIEKAIRNAGVLKWWNSCSPLFRSAVIVDRAKLLGCPACEVDETFAEPGELEWLAKTYAHTIELFLEDL